MSRVGRFLNVPPHLQTPYDDDWNLLFAEHDAYELIRAGIDELTIVRTLMRTRGLTASEAARAAKFRAAASGASTSTTRRADVASRRRGASSKISRR